MEIKQLESFVAVVAEKSFSRAAEKLFMTQPTITNHIQSLETQLDIALFNRTNKKVTLTQAGAILYEHALNILNIKHTALHELNAFKGKIEGSLEICASTIPAQYVLPQIMKIFTGQFPDVAFTIHQKNSKHVIDDILSGQINYGIVGGKYPSPSLEYIDFFDDKLTIIASAEKHDLGTPGTALTFDTLLKEKFIIREEGSSTRRLIEETLKHHHLKADQLSTISTIEDNETIKQLVALDVGLSFISEIAAAKEIELGLIKPYTIKNIDFDRKFYFVYHKNRYLSPLDQAFRDFVIHYSNR